MSNVREIETEEQMRALVEESRGATVVVFKYSPTCGISMVAQEVWEEWVETAPSELVLARCDVIAARSAARGVTTWLGIPHQSPQVLVLRQDAKVVQASHYSITATWLRAAVA